MLEQPLGLTSSSLTIAIGAEIFRRKLLTQRQRKFGEGINHLLLYWSDASGVCDVELQNVWRDAHAVDRCDVLRTSRHDGDDVHIGAKGYLVTRL